MRMDEVAIVTKGASYRSEDLREGKGWLVSLKCVGRTGEFRPDGMKPYSGPSKASQTVLSGDVLVAQTDLTQKAEVIGRPIRMPKLGASGVLVASLDFSIVRPQEMLTREALFALVSTQDFREHALAYCNGTTVLHMGSQAIPSYEFRLPDPATVSTITETTAPLFELADSIAHETESLATLRDTLLPKLLSGELRLRDAESLIEAAV